MTRHALAMADDSGAATATEAEMLGVDFFADDKDRDGMRNHTARFVTTRKPHRCSEPVPHPIPVGARARLDEAIVDGKWARFYTCAECLTKWVRGCEEAVE